MSSKKETKEKYKEFVSRVSPEEFLDYYKSHSAKDTAKYFSCLVQNVRTYARTLNYKKTTSDSLAARGINSIEQLRTKIPKEEFNEYYQTHTFKECAEHFEITEREVNRLRSFYKITRKSENNSIIHKRSAETVDFEKAYEKCKETLIKKYGSLEEAYNSIWEKAHKTYYEKTGYDNPMHNPEVQEKLNEFLLNKYGGRGYASDIIVNKINETILNKYSSFEEYNKELLIKRQKTNLEKYGNTCSFHGNGQDEKIVNTMMEKYGVPYYCMTSTCKSNSSNNSKPNQYFANLLKEFNIEYEREFVIENRNYDFKVGGYLIEIDPTATHNSTYNPFSRIPTTINYHQEKSNLAKKYGYKCIHIWDWDNVYKILDIINPNKTIIYARNCVVKEISKQELDVFLNEYHLQKTCRNQNIKLGLYHNNELMQVMSFGNPRYNKNYMYELLRLCTKRGIIVVGGAKKLFNYFIKKYNPKNIISYCDNSKFNGEIYTKLGFYLKDFGRPSKHWYNQKTKQHFTDNLVRQRGVDQLLDTNYGKGTDNNKLLLENGFVEIYDCGQSTYILKIV